jgi:hypothetical protein
MQEQLQSVVREMLLRRAAAQEALALVGPYCRRRPRGACADMIRMETAQEVWAAAILLLAPLLAERGQP